MTRGDAVLTRPAAAHPGGRPLPHPGWRAATVTQVRQETPTRTLVLRVPGWAGHDAGQHVELRLRRQPGSVLYRAEFQQRDTLSGLSVTYAYTRAAPRGAPRPPRRIDAGLLACAAWPPALAPTC